MDNLKQEIEQWEAEANPVTDEILNEMQEYYKNRENEEEPEEHRLKLGMGELKYLGYDY